MIKRTHLAVGLFFALFFLPQVTHKYTFVIVVLIASLLPDIDSASSAVGRSPLLKPLQWFVKHRGFVHSLTVCVAISILFSFYFPIIALPFFLGYSMHLLADSFTAEGIVPFWPWSARIKGQMRTGGKVEDGVFAVLVIVDLIVLMGLFI